MAKKFNIILGDIFTIPLGNGEFGFGHVVTDYNKRSGGFMMAVYDLKLEDANNLVFAHFGETNLLLLGFTFDAKIYHKDWQIIGNFTENIERIKMPYFRLGLPSDNAQIVNYKGEILSEIDDSTFEKLRYKSEIAPIRYENALKAHYGIQEWKDDYDKLLYKYAIDSNEVARKLGVG